jgi:hypothetical protein
MTNPMAAALRANLQNLTHTTAENAYGSARSGFPHEGKIQWNDHVGS